MANPCGDALTDLTYDELLRECRNKQAVINYLNEIIDGKKPAPEARAMVGEKSRPLYQPARSIAQDGKEHLYVFHRGLWYHFTPEGWKPPESPLPQRDTSEQK